MDSTLLSDTTKVAVTEQQSTKAAVVCVRSVQAKYSLDYLSYTEKGVLIFKMC
jgi:uncharacterized protein YycO